MIFNIETALLNATRDHLMEQLKLAADQIDIELDDEAPAMAGKLYFTVCPHGFRLGKKNSTATGIVHASYGIRVAVLQRITHQPRDRRREIFAGRLNSLNQQLSRVFEAMHWSSSLICKANKRLRKDCPGLTGDFTRQMVAVSADSKPKLQTGKKTYDSKSLNNPGHDFAAMVRGINFGEAEFFGSIDRKAK